ncbi:hypothetical protein SNEBB_000212 [Seison nebaliae]|nr:hypothetical protein SNEBB_000212 [Seison nebaliae]
MTKEMEDNNTSYETFVCDIFSDDTPFSFNDQLNRSDSLFSPDRKDNQSTSRTTSDGQSTQTQIVLDETQIMDQPSETETQFINEVETQILNDETQILEEDSIGICSEETQILQNNEESDQLADDSTQILGDSTQIFDDSTQILGDSTQIIGDSTQILHENNNLTTSIETQIIDHERDVKESEKPMIKPMLKRKSTEKIETDSESKLIKIESYFHKRELNLNKSMPIVENDATSVETKRQVSDETELKSKSSRKKITRNLLRTKFA